MLNEMQKRFVFVIIAIFVIVLGGSLGYYFILQGKEHFIDCLYMTVISLTTVGYGEVIEISGNIPAQIYTMILVTFGAGVILYGISTMTAMFIEGELSGLLRRKKMEKQISQLKRHYIVCGGGETGLALVSELLKNNVQVLLIEQDHTAIQRYQSDGGEFFVTGDATDDCNLEVAGIERAEGVLVCLPSDKDNLYITMTARMMNKRVRIISRMVNSKISAKLLKAGANGVVCPNSIGALRMASEMIRPAAVDFLDSMLRSNQGNLRIHQINITSKSSQIGQTIAGSSMKDRFNLLVLCIRHNGEMVFNPPATLVLEEGMELIVMGDVDQIILAQQQF